MANPGFYSPYLVEMRKDESTVTLRVVRPLAHATHPITPDESTAFVFATGPSAASSPLGQHGTNAGVRSRCVRSARFGRCSSSVCSFFCRPSIFLCRGLVSRQVTPQPQVAQLPPP